MAGEVTVTVTPGRGLPSDVTVPTRVPVVDCATSVAVHKSIATARTFRRAKRMSFLHRMKRLLRRADGCRDRTTFQRPEEDPGGLEQEGGRLALLTPRRAAIQSTVESGDSDADPND